MNGIVLINKPKGITSYDVIRSAKKVFKTTKIGHTGTLDPFAEGLLIICIGSATKLVNKLISSNKEYEGIIVFNNHYDTYDITGQITKTDSKIISPSDLRVVASSFIKTYNQVPPIYSALKKDGKPLYEYARKNIDVKINAREVSIYNLEILEEITKNEFSFKTLVSKGTYIRSLAVDIATSLETYGALKGLKRTKIDNYSLDNAVNLSDLTVSDLVDIKTLYKDSPSVILNDYMIKLVKNGIYLDDRQIETTKDFKVYNEKNELIAIYEVIGENSYKPLILL